MSSQRKLRLKAAKSQCQKFAILSMAWQGYFTDTEGNIFGVHQPDENAW